MKTFKQILNEIGDTSKGKDILSRYVKASTIDRIALGKIAKEFSRRKDPRSRESAREVGAKIKQRSKGIQRATSLLNEIGDTPRGQRFLQYYVDKRLKQGESGEIQRRKNQLLAALDRASRSAHELAVFGHSRDRMKAHLRNLQNWERANTQASKDAAKGERRLTGVRRALDKIK